MNVPGNSGDNPGPLILGHRANSLNMIHQYKNAGAQGVEIDVILNHRNRLRVEHVLEEDEYLDLLYRLEKGGLPSLRLIVYRLGRLLGRRESVKPLLDEYLIYLATEWPRSTVMIDLKTPRSSELLNISLHRHRGAFGLVLVTSKYHTLIADLDRMENVKRLVTLVSRPLHAIDYLRSLGADGISIEYPYVDDDLVRELHREGYLVAAWTVNDTLVAKHLARMGVDIIITDTPRKLIKALRRQKTPTPGTGEPGEQGPLESPSGFIPFLTMPAL